LAWDEDESMTTSIQSNRVRAWEAVAFIGVCVGIGVVCGVAVWKSATASLLALALLFGAPVALGLFGLIIPAMAALLVSAFLLMNRIDEGLIVSLRGNFALKVTYWFPALCLGFLMFSALTYTRPPHPATTDLRRYLSRAMLLLAAFCLFAILAMPINRVLETHVAKRDLLGEMLALSAILITAGLGIVTAMTSLTKKNVLLLFRLLIGLGGLSGLLMALFGLLPGRVLGLLGWTSAIGGTADLVRGRLPLGHPNTVCAILLLLLPPAVIFGMTRERGFWRLFNLGAAGLMFCGILFALSRSALICMTAGLGLTFGYLLLLAKGPRRTVYVFTSLGFAFLLVCVAMYLFSVLDFSRFWARGYYEDASVDRRQDSFRTACLVWGDHPILGVGPDAVYPRFDLRPGWMPEIRDSISPTIYYRGHVTAETPHNLYIALLAEFGVVGGLLFMGLLFTTWRMLWRFRRYLSINDDERKVITGLAFGIVAYLLMEIFSTILTTGLRPAVIFWVYVGLALRYAWLVATEATPEQTG
jgi:hypothetical protein